MNVLSELIRVHVDVSNGNRQTENLLHLELDGGLDLINLCCHRLGVSQKTRELSGFVKTWTQQTRDLLDERLGGKESVVLLCKLLHQLLVLVEFLQSFSIHEWNIVGLGLVAMLLISQDADLHFWARNELQPVEGRKENHEYTRNTYDRFRVFFDFTFQTNSNLPTFRECRKFLLRKTRKISTQRGNLPTHLDFKTLSRGPP
jgi:hypothetical protein